MFWVCFFYDKKKFYHIWKPETTIQKRVVQQNIDQRNEINETQVKIEWKLSIGVRRMRFRNAADRKSTWKWDEKHEKIVRKGKKDID